MEWRPPAGPVMSLEEYLVFEDRSPAKHEYVAGEVHAMTGVTTRHNLITLNLVRHVHAAARSHGCKVFATDVRLRVADRIYYPDVILACGRAAEVELIIEEPSLVVEVTSPSTRATDRREKLESYLQIPSLRIYLIVEQRRRHVLAYGRSQGCDWRRDEFAGQGDIAIPFLETRISLEAIYEGVELPPLAVGEREDWKVGDEAEGDDV